MPWRTLAIALALLVVAAFVVAGVAALRPSPPAALWRKAPGPSERGVVELAGLAMEPLYESPGGAASGWSALSQSEGVALVQRDRPVDVWFLPDRVTHRAQPNWWFRDSGESRIVDGVSWRRWVRIDG